MMSNIWSGIDQAVDSRNFADYEPKPITPEHLEECFELVRNKIYPPFVEYHNPRCPKWVTQGKKACRCGASPLEGIFEDELERMNNG